jgi:hypothetical protein
MMTVDPLLDMQEYLINATSDDALRPSSGSRAFAQRRRRPDKNGVRSPGRPILAGRRSRALGLHPVRGMEVLIIHRKRYGRLDAAERKRSRLGESVPACAVREVHEETGVHPARMPLDSITYEAGNAGIKKVDYWGGCGLGTRYAGHRMRRSTSSLGCRCAQRSAGSPIPMIIVLVQRILITGDDTADHLAACQSNGS